MKAFAEVNRHKKLVHVTPMVKEVGSSEAVGHYRPSMAQGASQSTCSAWACMRGEAATHGGVDAVRVMRCVCVLADTLTMSTT
jgi:hypothetical protein